MAKENVLLAKNWTPDINPEGYLMSEKLDGIRATWNGKNFVSRLGNVFPAPEHFKRQMPSGVILDGELWLGRNSFEETSSIVRCGSLDKGWNKLIYMAFDAPSDKYRFETRIEYVEKVVAQSKVCRLVDHVECKGKDHLLKALNNVIEVGGEGLMLRRPGSVYEYKRSNTLLKVKKFFDAEATIIGYAPGKGKYSSMLGALMCKLDNGVEFEIGIGFTDFQRANPPKIGTRVTFSHLGYMKSGSPRNAVYERVRQ